MPKKINITRTMTSGSTPGSFPTFSPIPMPSTILPPRPQFSAFVPPKDAELPQPAVAADKLESEELVKLLEIIDKLREFGVSEDISLPQVFSSHSFRPETGNK